MAQILVKVQKDLQADIRKLLNNAKKEPLVRRTEKFANSKLVELNEFWDKFNKNDDKLREDLDATSPYFTEGIYDETEQLFNEAVKLLNDYLDAARKINGDKLQNIIQEDLALFTLNEKRKRLQFRINKLDETIMDLQKMTQHKHPKSFVQNVIKNISKLIEDVNSQCEEVTISAKEDEKADMLKISDIIRQITNKANNMINRLFEEIENLENNDQATRKTPKLSPITIPKFDGQFKKWMSFKSLFMSIIHENKTLSNVERLQYLQTNVVGEVFKMISHLQLTNDNYEIAFRLIMDRYDNPRKLADVYLDTLLDLPATSGKSASSLKVLHDTVKECIEGLNTAGVEFCETPLLTRLCLRKLDTENLRAFEQSLKNPKQLPSFQVLLEFLETRYLLLDTIDDKKSPKSVCANYLQENKIKCLFCEGDHFLFHCKKFAELTVQKRSLFVQTKNLCRNCIAHKKNKKCTSKYTCSICKKNHHTLLHFNEKVKPAKNSNSVEKPSEIQNNQEVSRITSTHLRNKSSVLLSTALVYIKDITGRYEPFRALIDQGSQASLISESAAQVLGLPKYTSDIEISGVGLGASKRSKHRIFIEIRSHFGNEIDLEVPAYILPKLTGDLPNNIIQDDPTRWQNIILADPQYAFPGPIDVLLGADVYGSILLKGIKKGHPTAIRTKLGWILNGPIKTEESINAVQANVSLTDINDSIARFWSTENVSSTMEIHDDDEIYRKLSINRDKNGRYTVSLPFKTGEPKLGDSRRQAVARLLQVERSIEAKPMIKQLYHDFMSEYINCEHMIPLQNPSWSEGYYLPHHAVVNMDKSTTKLRVVFDASAKSSNRISLNDELMIGPTIQDNLSTILIRWRTHRFVFTADVEKMYRQIKIQNDHQKYQKILWRFSKDEPIQDFALTTVTYGTAAASYTATRVLKQIADDITDERYNNIRQTIKEDFYMDDLLSGANTNEEAIAKIHNLNHVLRSAGFTLRKWAANSSSLLEGVSKELHLKTLVNLDNESSIKMLGVWWNPSTDSFSYKISIREVRQRTKRNFLSEMSKIFDPLGWLAPITIYAKLMMQEIWASGIGWDEELSESFQQRWRKFEKDLPSIQNLNIPRYVQLERDTNFEIHGFCDASERAYAAVVYIRVQDSTNNFSIFLLGAKTRVAPLSKEFTIPRLELCGALLLVNYITEIKNAFQLSDVIPTYYWTDSNIALAWIKGNPSRWKTFIAHRVAEIQKNSKSDHWFYVNTKHNPADLASRSIKPNQIINNQLWWHGPSWLLETWQDVRRPMEFMTDEEEKSNKKKVNALHLQPVFISNFISKFSSLGKLIRVMAYLKRFKTKGKGRLSTIELEDATETIIKLVQHDDYAADIDNIKAGNWNKVSSKLLQLSPYIDRQGILRVGGRLENLKIKSIAKHPIILSASNHFSKLLVRHAHHQTLHGGNQLTLTYLRQLYWITNAKCLVKRVIHDCVTCFKFKAESAKQFMGNLPLERINPAAAFTNTGIDYAGPFDIRVSKGRGTKSYKGFIAVFVCMTTRAIHLEAVSDLTADAFIAAYKRFSSRRGNCLNIYSDNGSSFVGACRKLNKDFLDCIQKGSEYLSNDIEMNKTTWHFIPPRAPHFGGIWEAAVKSMKHHLKRVIGEQKLTFEELTTVLSQIEACLNSRPLVQLSNDPFDIEVLTPGHFLIGRPIISNPQPHITKMDYGSRWKLLIKMVQDFWKVWSNEYLSRLQHRPKWMKKEKNLQVGDLVLVKEDNLPPTRWALGRITETHPGKDGLVRTVTLRGPKQTVFKRPITKLCPFPTQENSESEQANGELVQSNCVKIIYEDNSADPGQKNNTCHAVGDWMNINDLSTAPQQVNLKTLEDSERKSARFWMRGENTDRAKEFAGKLKEVNQVSFKRRGPKIRPYFPSKVLLLMLSVLTLCSFPINASEDFNYFQIRPFSHQPGIYFEEFGNMRFQRNEWNLIIHYNLTIYKDTLNQIQRTLIQLKEMCHASDPLCNAIYSECKYLMFNINSSDIVLQSSNKDHHYQTNRRLHKRGLINGIGYIANELFGILDSRAAEKYETEIKELQSNNKYLIQLAQNHTSITDATLRLFSENTEFIKQELFSLNETIEHQIQQFSYTSTMLHIILKLIMTMMRIQELQNKMLDIILDTQHGKFNPVLLPPTYLLDELKYIRSNIPANVIIPDIINGNLADFYNLMTVKTRITEHNIIFSVKIPLPDVELHEIFKLIPLPISYQEESLLITPSSDYLIINNHRDHFYPLNENELSLCSQTTDEIKICKPHNPIFNVQTNVSKCEVALINHKPDFYQYCTMHIYSRTPKWVQLSKPNSWIYAMDAEYPIDIVCNSRIINSTIIKGQGIIYLNSGCLLKQNGLTIAARNIITSNIEPNFFPLINSGKIINTLEKQEIKGLRINEKEIQNKLKSLQSIVQQQQATEQEVSWINKHDNKHYMTIYIIILFGIISVIYFIIMYKKEIQRIYAFIQAFPSNSERVFNAGQLQVESTV